MSFLPKDLSVLAYANNFTLWHYKTDDQNALTDNYFSKASGMLRASDLIICQENQSTRFLVVTKSENGHVKVAPYA